MAIKLFVVALVFFGMIAAGLAQDQKNVSEILIDSRIAAANGHYKTVLIQIADKKTNAELAKTKGERQQIEDDLAVLEEDRKATEKEIADLVKEYNSLVRKRK